MAKPALALGWAVWLPWAAAQETPPAAPASEEEASAAVEPTPDEPSEPARPEATPPPLGTPRPPVTQEPPPSSVTSESLGLSEPSDALLTPDPLASFTPDVASPSPHVVINLINRLVERGVLTKGDAQDLIRQAQTDAAQARRREAEAALEAAREEAEANEPDTVRVTYIPETVKAQIRDELKQEVLAQAQREEWGAPKGSPSWPVNFHPSGDFRFRYDFTFFPNGNDNTGAFPNFNAINTGSPFDTSGSVFSPQHNVDQDRNRARIRLRLGTEIDLAEHFSLGVRLATGDSGSPVSTNQSLGASGGNFSKYAIWLDRAYLKYELDDWSQAEFSVSLGRFDNPFFSTNAIFDEDLGFDGLAIKAKLTALENFHPWLTLGTFPIFNTDFNFSSNRPDKFESSDKWLLGAQVGVDWKLTKDIEAKIGVAYYDFLDVEGELSDPYVPLSSSDAGNTDGTRPSFAQKGNTYRPLRQIVPTALNNYGTTHQYQYYGLATPFRNIAVTGRLDFNHYEPIQISLVGEYIKNLAFNSQEINRFAVNNRGPIGSDGTLGGFEGSDTAWQIALQVGKRNFEKRGDWNATLGYRYIGSDAVIDGLTDSDFGGGGTNLEGYFIGGNMALSRRVWLGARWMSADEIAGPPLRTDVLFIDLNAKF